MANTTTVFLVLLVAGAATAAAMLCLNRYEYECMVDEIRRSSRKVALLGSVLAVLSMLSGCASTTRTFDKEGRMATETTSYGLSSSAGRCFRKIVGDAVGGGLIGYVLDKKTGARIVGATGAVVGLTECGDDTPNIAMGQQSRQVAQMRHIPGGTIDNPEACHSQGGEVRGDTSRKWTCHINLGKVSRTNHQVTPVYKGTVDGACTYQVLADGKRQFLRFFPAGTQASESAVACTHYR